MTPTDETTVTDRDPREQGQADETGGAEPEGAAADKAHAWAEAHPIKPYKRPRGGASIGNSPLLTELRTNALKLQTAHEQINLAAHGPIVGDAYANEWFLDNYYLIRASIQQALQDLPEKFYRQLPRLAKKAGYQAGTTRVGALAAELAEESSSRIDPDEIVQAIDAYQRTAPLTMGELWALPAMLRIVLVERLTEAIERLNRPDEKKSDEDASDRAIEADSEQVANCITGLRTINNHDWNSFFERLSLVEHTLRGESCGYYAQMDFATRDRYRKAVEGLAAGADSDEPSVAAAAVKLAAEAPDEQPERYRHVGYYLIDGGVATLRREIGYRPRLSERFRNVLFANPATVYLGSVAVLSLLLLVFAVWHAWVSGAAVVAVVLLLLVIFAPAVAIAVEVVNLLLSHLLPPRLLPKLDFTAGIPTAFRTVVVVPALIGSDDEVDDLLEQIERHYLGNSDPELRFALLTDFRDANAEHQPSDDAVVARAKAGIEALNQRYENRPFYLLHRKRLWNELEGVWMGWERKRGKLMEFNRLLRGDADTSYDVIIGDRTGISDVKYVLTLDADTRLPPAAAHRLVGALAHPLNRVEFDSAGKVVAGYSLLQPRTDILPESSNSSYFSRLFVGENGLDLYTLAVSDVYQDLFGAGIYVGKGLYDVDGFQRALADKIPENTVLSHDLLEGIYGGVGLVSDVVLYEDYPPNYLAQVMRVQRWVRGDWQLLPWLAAALSRHASSGRGMGVMDAWKIFDNLRRSLLMPAITLMLVLGWTVLPGSPLVWTLMALIALGVPLLGSALGALLQAVASRRDVGEWRNTVPWGPVVDAARRYFITLAFVPFEAILVLASIGTTIYRMFVSRRKLLEWQTARSVALSSGLTLVATSRRMGLSLLFTVLVLVWLILFNPAVLIVAGPVLLLWLLAPVIAYGISRSLTLDPEPLSSEQRTAVRAVARRTWLYFEQFVGPEDNWLPPDNVQLHGEQITAHRTSPTNIGLLLLSTLSAYDLGYLGVVDLSLRFRQTLEVMGRMERYRGHMLNWYDTRSLEPLTPRYVSSVDSGNLVGSLLAVKEGCLELIDQPVEPVRRWNGLLDTLAVLDDVVREALGDSAPMLASLEAMRNRIEASSDDPSGWPALLEYLAGEGWGGLQQEVVEAMEAGALGGRDLSVTRAWAERVQYNIRVTQRELTFLLPWERALADAANWSGGLATGGAAHAQFQELRELLSPNPTLRQLPALCTDGRQLLGKLKESLEAEGVSEAVGWCDDLARRLASSQQASAGLIDSYHEIAAIIEQECEATDFTFLYDDERKLLRIGYNVDTERLDDNYYDLLASESRLASLVAIAKGDLPVSHWLHLGRPLAALQGRATLLSWSGTMFEYLMPTLLTRRYGGTLLEQSSASAIEVQRLYGQKHGVPWGISESSYGRVDGSGTYQYRAFGVPELALNRGQDNDLVIAPYASALALRIRPKAVVENFQRFEKVGAMGPYGFYEALDYTPSRKPLDADFLLVRSYMAHHQGMALVELANALSGDAMVRRFHANARIATVELLLQERVPTQVPTESRLPHDTRPTQAADASAYERPWPAQPGGATPSTHLLSNGNYSVLLNAAGGGYSRAGDDAITRWRADGTLNDNGSWVYLRDEVDGELWSVTEQPLGGPVERAKVEFSPSKAEYSGVNHGISSRLEVCVGEYDAELRRLTLINQGDNRRRLKITSYAEVVLGDLASDQRHPAFSKLFVESSYDPHAQALIFRRRTRSDDESPRYAAHLLLLPHGISFDAEYETDRAKFLGRGHNIRSADGPRTTLSNTVGATLDPVMALGQKLELAPHSQATLTFVTAHAATEEELLATIKHLRGAGMVERQFNLARSRSRNELRRNQITVDALEQYQRLLSGLIYPNAALRSPPERLAANTLGQSSLWGQGISGDYPIILARIEEQEELPLIVDLVAAHGYWRRRGFKADVVVLNTKASAYSQEVQGRLRWLLSRTGGDDWLDARGGIFLLRQDQLAPADQVLLDTVARVVLNAADGPLSAQLDRAAQQFEADLPPHRPERVPRPTPNPVTRPTELQFDNGWGGFSSDGREYQVFLEQGELPPAPWTNVVANEKFGFMLTEGGLGSSWSINSGENRLTPWHNDPVTDPPSEVVYLRDEQSGEVWSATPLPTKSGESFVVRHGAGYTVYQQNSHGLNQELEVFAAADDPVKIVRLRVENDTGRERRVTVTYYAPWILGIDHDASQLFVIPSYDAESCALLATNPYNSEFGERVAFLASNKSPHGLTTDRREFLGVNGSLVAPAGLRRIGLSGATRVGADPCAVLQLHLDLDANGSEEVVFVLGQAENREQALELADRYRNLDNVPAARTAMHEKWDGLLDQLQIATPDAAMNVLTNRWLNYQTLSSRLWGRSAFYQSSGAFGFRDQLQDVLALIHTAPELAREQLLQAAAHQFEEGDVLHWWHPPSGRGVRTRISDDLLWLVYVAAEYVRRTGDSGVLDETVPFLHGPTLAEGEDERYDQYQVGDDGTLLEHCLRALKKGATEGTHGLPLMGGGDWNDGMNRVGIKGRGESVWLGWFLITTIERFAPVLAAAGRQQEAEAWRSRAEKYRVAIENNAWDGEWYLRAYFDDGSPLGSRNNEECTIDSIAQSWAVLAGGDEKRSRQALAKVDELLVRDEDRLIRLFTPAFDKTPRDPGYIKGYLPGVRENGGQYTHGAIWTAWAFAEQGDGDRAHELYTLLNPVRHSQDRDRAELYKVEPYVTAADVYSLAPHVGRGGWTWYTGSAAWYYRLAVEAILGVKREGSQLTVDPMIPKAWPGFSVNYREGKSTYRVVVDNSAGVNSGVKSLQLDGEAREGAAFELVDDGAVHEVRVVLGDAGQ